MEKTKLLKDKSGGLSLPLLRLYHCLISLCKLNPIKRDGYDRCGAPPLQPAGNQQKATPKRPFAQVA